jgi:hypothetical protein
MEGSELTRSIDMKAVGFAAAETVFGLRVWQEDASDLKSVNCMLAYYNVSNDVTCWMRLFDIECSLAVVAIEY